MRDWEKCYQDGETPWDKGAAAPPLMEVLVRHGAGLWGGGQVLVPGCGVGHDVRALAEAGVAALGLDIAESAVERARGFPVAGGELYETGDFLDPGWREGRRFSGLWEHTCFCAIDPSRRGAYAESAAAVLDAGGVLAGVFYLTPNGPGEEGCGPPFNSSIEEIDGWFDRWFERIDGWVPRTAYPGREGREWVGFSENFRKLGLRDLSDHASVPRELEMRTRLTCLLLALLPWTGLVAEGRIYVNDKKAPENRRDLEAIQAALITALPKARAATVGIEIDEGSGTGVIVSEDGLVLTAAHVSGGVKKKVTVVLEDGTKLKAETLGLVSDTDAAMLRITEEGKRPYVEIDREDSVRLGDWVFALGHSGGFDKERGLVVRLGRLVRMANSTFQSDCILIGGDSGGPLFDLTGRLVGINSRVGGEVQENMHVPMSEFTKHWDEMLGGEFIGEGPFAKKPVKGSGFLGLATNPRPEGGLVVTKVGKKTPAEAAGFKEGDVILKLNDTPLSKREDLQEILKELAAGDEVTFEMEREGQPETLTLNLGAR